MPGAGDDLDDFENTGELDSWLKDRPGRTGECKQFNDFTDWSNPTTSQHSPYQIIYYAIKINVCI